MKKKSGWQKTASVNNNFAKLSASQVFAIRRMRRKKRNSYSKEPMYSYSDLAKMFSISLSQVYRICKRKNHKNIELVMKYNHERNQQGLRSR